jgi:hypothetical protein
MKPAHRIQLAALLVAIDDARIVPRVPTVGEARSPTVSIRSGVAAGRNSNHQSKG